MNNTETRFTVVVFNFLQNTLRYPLESIAISQHGDEHFRADVSIIDPDTARVLAFIEVKLSLEPGSKKRIAQNYQKFVERSKLTVPVYLFVSSELTPNEPAIHVLIDNNEWEQIGTNQFPTLPKLIAANDAQQKIEISKTKVMRNEAVDELKILSQYIFTFLLLLFFAPWFGLTYTDHQLLVLLGAIVVVMLPKHTRIKAFGVELERVEKRTKSD